MSEPFVCPECRGLGGEWIEATDTDDEYYPDWVDCVRCNGTGELDAGGGSFVE